MVFARRFIPRNYPSQIFGRCVAAALAVGNTVVLKPAEDACLSVLSLAKLTIACGLPAGVLNVVPGLGREAGAALAAHPGIDHLSFTGSPDTGTQVTQAAAKHHVPVTLELGGKSPQIFLRMLTSMRLLTQWCAGLFRMPGKPARRAVAC